MENRLGTCCLSWEENAKLTVEAESGKGKKRLRSNDDKNSFNKAELENSTEYHSEEYYISVTPGAKLGNIKVDSVLHGNTVLLISSNTMGTGAEELGKVLMRSFIYTMSQMTGFLKSVIFINSGVFLTTEGSEFIENIQALEERGIEILSCLTSLDFYGLSDRLMAGSPANMFTISEKLMQGHKTLCL